MAERKPYKTRLCMLYQRGACSRQHCNFAHGNAEIRRSADGRQEYRGRDLRESLGRKRSPLHRYSPARDTRMRGNGPYPIHRKRIDREQRNNFHDNSGSLKMSDRDEDQNIERRQIPSDSQLILDEQLRQVQYEIKMLENDKQKLETFLQEKVQESDTRSLKIRELEVQLSNEKEEAKRITSKIKKFIKAHNRHLRLQEELKRSCDEVQKLGQQLDSDAARPGIDGEDTNINSVSEDDTGVNYVNPVNEYQFNSSPSKKRSQAYREAHEASNQEGGGGIGRTRLERYSGQIVQPINNSRNGAVNQRGHLASEERRRRGAYPPSDIASTEKVLESGHLLPSTGLAAHAVDEDVEVVVMEDKFQVIDAATNGTATDSLFKSPLLSSHVQYKENTEHVDIDVLDDELVDVDIV